jgi:lysophospholipase L1-like esterase
MKKRFAAINTLSNSQINYRPKALNLLLFFICLFFTAYLFWEYYWYTQVSWHFIKWHTHLAPYVFILIVLFIIAAFKQKFNNKLLIATTICGSLLFAEFCLTMLYAPLYTTFDYDIKNYYHVWPPNNVHRLKGDEFDFIRTTNSLGFSASEWTKDKGTKKRIIALGDSFTEGDGAAQDSSYPALLQNILNSRTDSTEWEVLNAGTCGSDPVFNYQNLHDRLLAYKPDIVLQTISTHDLSNDIDLRGGFERFKPDGTLKAKSLPTWFYPAVFSNLAWLVIKVTGVKRADWGAVEQIERDLANKYGTLAATNNIKIVFILLPIRSELKHKGAFRHDFSPLLKTIATHKNTAVLNLIPCYLQGIKDYNGINNLYWIKNSHHNGTGYRMMAECIATAIK